MEEIVEMLNKFKGLEVLNWKPYTNLEKYLIWMTVEDPCVMQMVLNVFLFGGWKWKSELTVTHVGTRVKPALICCLDKEAFEGDEADLKRELDYKKCLLKSALGQEHLLK